MGCTNFRHNKVTILMFLFVGDVFYNIMEWVLTGYAVIERVGLVRKEES